MRVATVHGDSAIDVDAAIESIGVGKAQLPAVLATGLTWSGDAMEMSVIAYVLPMLVAEWDVSQPAADSFASIIFVGMLLGALGWGVLCDAFGRRVGWQLSTALTAVAGVLSAAAPSRQTRNQVKKITEKRPVVF